jgi:hypothetical protein
MTLEQKIRDQIDRIVGTHIYNIVWHPVAGATLSTDIYFHADRDLRKTITENTNKLRRALLPKLYEYKFAK